MKSEYDHKKAYQKTEDNFNKIRDKMNQTSIPKFKTEIEDDDRVLNATLDEETGIIRIEVFKPCVFSFPFAASRAQKEEYEELMAGINSCLDED